MAASNVDLDRNARIPRVNRTHSHDQQFSAAATVFAPVQPSKQRNSQCWATPLSRPMAVRSRAHSQGESPKPEPSGAVCVTAPRRLARLFDNSDLHAD